MSLEMSLVLSILVIRINTKRVLLDDRAQQVKARVLIPPAAFVEIYNGKKDTAPTRIAAFQRSEQFSGADFIFGFRKPKRDCNERILYQPPHSVVRAFSPSLQRR